MVWSVRTCRFWFRLIRIESKLGLKSRTQFWKSRTEIRVGILFYFLKKPWLEPSANRRLTIGSELGYNETNPGLIFKTNTKPKPELKFFQEPNPKTGPQIWIFWNWNWNQDSSKNSKEPEPAALLKTHELPDSNSKEPVTCCIFSTDLLNSRHGPIFISPKLYYSKYCFGNGF